MIESRFVSDPASFFVRKLRHPAAPSKLNTVLAQDLKRPWRRGVARIRKTDRLWNLVLFAPLVDSRQLLCQKPDGFLVDAEMVASVVADFKTVSMQLCDLVPRHVVRFVVRKIEALGNVERRAEPVPFQNWPHDCEV